MKFENISELQEYAQLKSQEKQIKSRLSEISPVVTTILEEIGERVDVDGGQVGLTSRKTWEYPKYISAQITKKKQEIKELEKVYQIKNPDNYKSKRSPIFYEGK